MKYLATLTFIFAFSIYNNQEQDGFGGKISDIEINDLENPIHKAFELNGTIWAVDYGDGNVYKSEKNGSSWHQLATLGSEYFEAVQFVSNKIGYICGDYGYIYKSIDGGESWKEISPQIEGRILERYRNDSTKNQQPDGLFVAYYSMYFVNEFEGFASGYQFNPSKGFRDSYKRIQYTTQDGGENWNELDEEAFKNDLEKLKKKAKKANITFNKEYFSEKNISWETAKSSTREDIVIRRNYQTDESDTVYLPKLGYERIMLRSVLFTDGNTGYILGGSLGDQTEAVIFKTNNGGNSWELLESDWSHIHVAISNEKYMWIFGKDGLMKRIKIGK